MPLPPSVGSAPLDGPPPSPTPMGEMGGGPLAMQGLAPQVPTDQLPPEVLTGIMQAAQKVAQTLDSFAQFTPDKGAQLALIKDLLQRYLADLTVAGAGAVSPTAPGPAFPGGGIDRGIAGPGSI
jgi:hypothetical protein